MTRTARGNNIVSAREFRHLIKYDRTRSTSRDAFRWEHALERNLATASASHLRTHPDHNPVKVKFRREAPPRTHSHDAVEGSVYWKDPRVGLCPPDRDPFSGALVRSLVPAKRNAPTEIPQPGLHVYEVVDPPPIDKQTVKMGALLRRAWE